MRRPGRIATAAPALAPWTPANVPTADRVAWWRCDQGVTQAGSRISVWEDIWNGEDFIQGLGGQQTLYEATGFLGMPCSTNDDGVRRMLCTLGTSIPIGTRVYMVVISQVTTTAANSYLATVADAGAANVLLSFHTTAVNWSSWRQESLASFELVSAIAYDTNVHRFEVGYTVGGTATRVIDGSSNNTAITGTNGTAMTQVRIHARYDGVAGLRSKIAEVIVLKNEPSYKALLRGYTAARYPGLP